MVVASMMDSIMWYLTAGAGTFYPTNGLVALFTLDARSAYPWPLCWGNALWGYVAFRQYRDALPAGSRPGPGFAYAVLATFVFYTMPANIFTNLLVLGRAPTALASALVIPAHLAACCFVEFVPGAFALMSTTVAHALVLDSMGVLDNVTTGFNMMEETHGLTGSPFAAVLAAMCVNVAGGVARHFMARGFADGARSFDAAFASRLLYSLATNGLYYALAVGACVPQASYATMAKSRVFSAVMVEAKCPNADPLYVVLPLVAVVKNALPVVASMLKRKQA